MNVIKKRPLSTIGYDFIEDTYLPAGEDEYHLRNLQNRNGITYRNLTAYEIEVLVRNRNTSSNWNNLQVSDAFNPELVKNCKFYGLVRIGKLEPMSLEFHNVCVQVGMYDSTIISCDFGDNVVINNVNYISHYIVGSEVIISNVHELHVTNHSKFGNGIIKDGEGEDVRVWLEICNENAGRKILPFNGMLAADAYLWSKYRDDKLLMQRFKEFTEHKFDKQRGYYGKIGDRTVIKNTSIIKDVWIGTDAYIKGANKLKNLTINSSAEAHSQIGEGCEMVNGIIGYGCRAFYGVKAVRFIMASHSQLKYGARLINSYLGNNSTISCCEVLNSLIFPAHEQHHNNSFLCAATVLGQSNMAAGATIGSNHNSRAADGEILAGRGFWPGLCVSLKHNSKFASFILIAKGDYSAELNIPLPFSLISNDVANNKLVIMPAYWFMYNMYALARNAQKYVDRDKRTHKLQHFEYDFLAPDSVNELFAGLKLLATFAAKSSEESTTHLNEEELIKLGDELLNSDNDAIKQTPIYADGFENSNRPVEIIKTKEAYNIYKQLVVYYAITEITNYVEKHAVESFNHLLSMLPEDPERSAWHNVGGQLMPEQSLETLMQNVRENSFKSWEDVHQFYAENSSIYYEQKLQHAFASLLELLQIKKTEFDACTFHKLMGEAVSTREWMVKNIYASRSKDYQSAFRKMMYDTDAEMEEVIGKLEDNVFIQQQQEQLSLFKEKIEKLTVSFSE